MPKNQKPQTAYPEAKLRVLLDAYGGQAGLARASGIGASGIHRIACGGVSWKTTHAKLDAALLAIGAPAPEAKPEPKPEGGDLVPEDRQRLIRIEANRVGSVA